MPTPSGRRPRRERDELPPLTPEEEKSVKRMSRRIARDPKRLDAFLERASLEFVVRLRYIGRRAQGRDFLDAMKLWERVIMSGPTAKVAKPGSVEE